MAEVLFIGRFTNAQHFPTRNLGLEYQVIAESLQQQTNEQKEEHWTLIQGQKQGKTHIDQPIDDKDHIQLQHPIELHYQFSSIASWPKILIECFTLDEFGRRLHVGYGYTLLPMTAGKNHLEIPVWKVRGQGKEMGWKSFLESNFLGVDQRLKDKEWAVLEAKDRFRLQTESMGFVYLDLMVWLKGLESFSG